MNNPRRLKCSADERSIARYRREPRNWSRGRRAGRQHGFDVAVNYREDERAASAIVEAVRASGVRALALKGDVAVEADVVRMFEAVDTFGPLKALVNNAGVTGGFSRVADIKGAVLERVLAVNVTGACLCARRRCAASRPSGRRRRFDRDLSSLAAKLGGGGEWVHYAASKGAINTFTVGLARESLPKACA